MKYLRIGLLVTVLLLLSTTLVSADKPDHVGPAVISEFPNGDACWIFDVDFNMYYIDDCSPKHGVLIHGTYEYQLWSAKGQLPEGAVLPEQGAAKITYENSGFTCWGMGGVSTTHYSLVITPNGKFNITCQFRPDRWQPEE